MRYLCLGRVPAKFALLGLSALMATTFWCASPMAIADDTDTTITNQQDTSIPTCSDSNGNGQCDDTTITPD